MADPSRAGPSVLADRLRLVLDQLPLAYVELSPALVVTEWSRAAERIFEFTREEAVGRPVMDLVVPPEGRSLVEGLLKGLLESEANPIGPADNVTRSGRRIVCEWSNVRLRDASGATVGIASLAQDVTGRAQAERALQESETKLRALFEHSRDAIGVSVQGVHTFVNPAYLRLFGYERSEDLVGRSILDLIAPEQRERILANVRQRAAGGPAASHYETRGLRRDGTAFDMEVGVSLFEQHGVSNTLVFLRDVTERHQTLRALQQSEERFRALIEKSYDAVTLLDASGRVTYHSPSFQRVTGRSPSERVGRSFLDTVHPDDAPAVTAEFRRLLQSPDHVAKLTIRIRVASGEDRWIELVGTNHLADPAVGGLVVNFRDVTERVRADEERRKLEEQVRHVQKLESLGVLAGGIAHDFNNLLMAMMGHASLALDALPQPSAARDNVAEIEKATRRAAELTKQMLAYSGKGRFQLRAVDLGELVKDMASMLELSVSKKALLRLDVARGLPPVEVDLAQVRQVVMNLVINASDALCDRSGVVAVSVGAAHCDRSCLAETYLDERLPEGTYVFLEVADTGCGMDEATRSKIFDPFFTTKFAGRGLGLASVLGIVRGHKGAIRVHSEEGKGSTFRVLLPASGAAAQALEEPASRAGLWRSSGTVLLADDEESVRTVGRMMLSRLGFAVEVAADGREALDLFRRDPQRYTAVVLDLTMPTMDGVEALGAILDVLPAARVLLSSGYSEQELAERFAGRGFAAFLQKPYALDDLTRVLRGVLQDPKR